MNDLITVARVIGQAQRIILTGHVMPDGDSLGSVLALGLALESQGKEVVFVSGDPIPPGYAFLPEVHRFAVGHLPPGNYDLLVVLDCSVRERLPNVLRDHPLLDANSACLDHHASATLFCRFNYIDPRAAAVGEIVFDLLGILGIPITPPVATCLYVAIVTDTGSFRYETTTAATHRRVAALLDTGIDPAAISRRVYEEKPLRGIRLLQAALASLKVSPGGRVAWMTVDHGTMQALGATDADADGLVDYARIIEGVEVAILLREVAPGKTRVGFRSKKYVDVNRLAALFGGGGHPRAAGCLVDGRPDEAAAMIIPAAVQAAGE